MDKKEIALRLVECLIAPNPNENAQIDEKTVKNITALFKLTLKELKDIDNS